MHPNSVPRRRHSDALKAKVVAACNEPGASISGVALAHGLNANLVRKWRGGRGFKHADADAAITLTKANKVSPPLGTTPEFVAIQMPAPAKTAARAAAQPMAAAPSGEPQIQVELRRGPLHLSVRWPASAGGDCTAWLRELSSGLLK